MMMMVRSSCVLLSLIIHHAKNNNNTITNNHLAITLPPSRIGIADGIEGMKYEIINVSDSSLLFLFERALPIVNHYTSPTESEQ